MSGNCGIPDGHVHSHVERCYQAGRADGRRELEDAIRAVLAEPDDVQEWEFPDDHVRRVEVVDVARLRALLSPTTDTPQRRPR